MRVRTDRERRLRRRALIGLFAIGVAACVGARVYGDWALEVVGLYNLGAVAMEIWKPA